MQLPSMKDESKTKSKKDASEADDNYAPYETIPDEVQLKLQDDEKLSS